MKKFLPALLTLLYFFAFTLWAASRPAPALAAGPCDVLPEGMTAETCDAISKLFESQPDGPWYNQNPTQFAKKITQAPADEIFGERYTFAQINWIINSIATMLNPAAGIDSPTKLFEFINAVKNAIPATGKIPTIQDYAKLGPAGLFAGGISALYTNPPASGIGEVKYMAGKLFDYTTGTQPAYAQGYGFTGLGGGAGANSAVRALWTASRNMAYLIMVILLVASGFLIMFRVKINPQTVVSLQTMIPKLIITMLLVTFSFAIAGLIIDLIYVVIAAFVGMLGFTNLVNSVPAAIRALTDSNFLGYVILQSFTSIIFTLSIAGLFALTGLGGNIAGPVIGLVLVIIVGLYWLINLFKIFWMLIKAYVMLILQICIAPLQIMLDLIPGQQGFGPWLRNFIANASVFVVVPIMLVIQHILSWDPFTNLVLGLKSLGPFNSSLGGTDLGLPFLGSKLQSWDIFTRWGIGFVIFAMTPKIADMIRDALKIPAFKYGAAFGEALGPISMVSKGALDMGGPGRQYQTDAAKQAALSPTATPADIENYRQLLAREGWISRIKGGLDSLKKVS